MEKLLIVEDEKMIRKGIRAIAERSGVCIGEIIEARNGLEAYEYLSSHKVDMMLTDIRMPKMDGVLLVQKLKEEHRLPKVIIISGYDDFQYATELMRCGARDYLLKPVDMEQVISILQKMEEEIQQEKCKLGAQEKLRKFQLKSLLEQKERGEERQEEYLILEKQFTDFFQGSPLVVVCTPLKIEEIKSNEAWEIIDEEGQFVYVLRQESFSICVSKETEKVSGISDPFTKLSDISIPYIQAKEKRKRLFLQILERKETQDIKKRSAAEMEQLLGELQIASQVQMIGTPKVGSCIEFLQKLLWNVQSGKYTPALYFQVIDCVMKQMQEQYKDVYIPEEQGAPKKIIAYTNAKEHLAYLEKYMHKINAKIAENYEEYKNQMKMREAIQYIHEHYSNDLNMAEVSNHIGISYSWFSTVFKQYVGTNFVNYLKNIRLEEAKKLLSSTDDKIQDISRQVGYENEIHFMKIFKSTCGLSPTKYRKVCHVVKECGEEHV